MSSLWYRRARFARSMHRLAKMAFLAVVVGLTGCPEEAPPRDSGVGGVSTEYMGAGGAPPIGGMTGGDTTPAGAGGEGAAGAGSAGAGGVVGGMSGGQPPAGQGGQPPAGQGGMGPIMERVFDAGMDPNRNNVQAGMLCERLAQINCAGEQYCCEDPGRDRAACESAVREACMKDAYLDAISNNDATAFDQETAAVTFAEIERLASICDPSIVRYSISPDGFMSMFRGTADSGDSCFPSGTQPEAAAAKLASCTDITRYACLPQSVLSWRCVERGGADASCFTDVNCVDGFYCPNPDLKIGQFKCAPRKPVGDQCVWGNECESLFCEAGTCVPESQRNAYCLQLSM
jgi:hypothetical protein